VAPKGGGSSAEIHRSDGGDRGDRGVGAEHSQQQQCKPQKIDVRRFSGVDRSFHSDHMLVGYE
jgi:hypothetical protein